MTARERAHDVPAECLQFVQVSLTLEESPLRTSAGGCGAAVPPTYRRALAGAFVRCAGDSPLWRDGRALPFNRGPLAGSPGARPGGPCTYPKKGPAPIIPPTPPRVKGFSTRNSQVFK